MSIAKYIEDIYLFEVNTKYISSNALKISVISRVHSTSEIAIFNTSDEIYLVFTEKGHFSIILLGSARLVGIILGVNIVCT